MARLVNHVNVYSSCIALMDRQGWVIRIVPGPYEAEDSRLDSYEASRDGTTIYADNPLELLGLAAIHEHHHPHTDEPYWWRITTRDPNLIERLEGDALERSFFDYQKRDPEGWIKCVKAAIHASIEQPEVSAHDRLGICKETFIRVVTSHPELRNQTCS